MIRNIPSIFMPQRLQKLGDQVGPANWSAPGIQLLSPPAPKNTYIQYRVEFSQLVSQNWLPYDPSEGGNQLLIAARSLFLLNTQEPKSLFFWLFDWLIDWLTGCLITISKWQVHWIGYCFITLAGTIILLQIYSWYSFCIKEKGCSNTCSIISYS